MSLSTALLMALTYAFRLSSIANVANKITCTVAPEAYQKGPLTP